MSHKDAQYATGVEIRPELDRHLQTNVRGIHIVGAANGSPLLKTCLNEGVQVVRSISRMMPPSADPEGPLDLLIVGAGPAGISAALEAKKQGYRFAILEQGRALNTILNFPEGKKIYAEPVNLVTHGELQLEDSTKEQLLDQWTKAAADLEITHGADVIEVRKSDDVFEVETAQGRSFIAARVILAIGRMGNPRTLGIPGEDLDCVHTNLFNPGKYKQKKILVIGGGNSAVEAALALAPHNKVTLAHRGDQFPRISKKNRQFLDDAKRAGQLEISFGAGVTALRKGEADVEVGGESKTIQQDVTFVLIGADPPTSFLKRVGVRFEGQWRWSLLPKLLWVFALIYSLYAIKAGRWPYQGAYAWLNSIGADPSLLYGILYTGLLSVFGLRAMRKYKDDSYQQKRYRSLIASQWLIYFLLPWVLFYAGYSEWWRTWAVSLTYPLGYYGLFEPASKLFSGTVFPWAIATLVAFLIVMPIVSIYHGKRFCAWVCPCGGIADTVGDAWRHKAPRGGLIRRFESFETVILVVTLLASVFIISDYRGFLDPKRVSSAYKLIVDFGLASVVAIALYPFTGSRIWCRFFCPLAKWMELWSRWTGGKLAIIPNDECISCGECTRYCQMGIDVRAFAQREEPLSNKTTECIFCGICVTVCPVDVLHVGRPENTKAGAFAA